MSKTAAKIFVVALILKALILLFSSSSHILLEDDFQHMEIADSIREGRGFETDVIFPLTHASESFPQRYFLRPPMYIFSLAAMNQLFGRSPLSSQLLNVLLESLNTALTYILAKKLTKDRQTQLMAALFYVTSPLSTMNTLGVLSESMYVLFCLILFISLAEKRIDRYPLMGLVLGLAYLTRIQAIFTFGFTLLYARVQMGAKAKHLATILVTFMLVVSPWMIWLYKETGNPMFSWGRYGVLIPFGEDKYFSGDFETRDMVEIISSRFTWDIQKNLFKIFIFIIFFSAILFPNQLMVPLILLTRKKIDLMGHPFFRWTFAYFLLILMATTSTYGRVRYLSFYLPIAAVIFAQMAGTLLDGLFAPLKKGKTFTKALVLIFVSFIIVVNGFGILDTELDPDFKTLTSYIIENITEDDVVIASFPYYIPYLTGAKAVQIPAEQKNLEVMIERYGGTHVILHKLWWENFSGERYLKEVYRNDNFQVFEVKSS